MISIIKEIKFSFAVLLLFFWMSSCKKNVEDIQSTISTSDNKTETQSLVVASWSNWEVLDLGLVGTLTSGPTVASWSPGRLDVFAKRNINNHLWTKWYNGSWHEWGDLGGKVHAGPSPADAVSWSSGRLDVFIRGTDDHLWHRWYNGSWQDWEDLGGDLASGPTAASWSSGRLDVFARGTDNHLKHIYFRNGSWHINFNSKWGEDLGSPDVGFAVASAPDAVSWDVGRLDVFARGTDNHLWHKWYNGAWSVWEDLKGNIYSGPTVASWASGRLDVFARSKDNELLRKWHDNNGWNFFWDNLGAGSGGFTSDPDAVSWGPDRLDVFVRGADDKLYHKYYSTP